MSFTGAAARVDVSGGLGQGETRPQGFTGIGTTGYVIGRTNDRIIEIADMSDPDTSVFVSASIGNSNSMAAHNGSLFVFIGTTLKRFDPPFSATDEGTDVLITTGTPRALTSDGTNLWYINQIGTGNVLVRIDDIDGTPDTTAIGSIPGTSNFRGLVWHDGFFWGVDPSTDALYVIDESDYSRTQVGSFSQFVGPIVTPQGLGVVDGVGYIVANDNSGSLWELRDFKFTAEIADQSWTVGTAVSISAPATEDGETPITYAISPALPAGVTLDTSTGGISGTPTATDDATDYTLTATDDNGIETTTTFSASVVASGAVTLVATTLEIVSGNNQSATEEEALANPLIVQVNDQNGDPFQGATVTFSVSPNDATLGTTTATTDSDGRAQTTLTLGETVGNYTVTASVTDLTDVEFTATATATVVTPVLGWEVPSGAVGNTFSATLTSNVALDAAPTVGDLRLRDDDNSDPIVALNSSNTTISAIAGTNNYLIEIVLTGTYDDDYTIRINGNTVEYNGAFVISAQLASAVFSIDSSIGVLTPPTFTAPASAYEVDERANATIDSTDFFSGHTSLAFSAGYTAPSWITISSLDVVITDAPDVTADTDYTVELTATNDDGDVDGSITVAVQQIDPAPVIGTLSRIDINEGQSETVDLSGDLQNTDTLVITSSQSWVSVSGLSLVITDAPDVSSDTDYTVNLRAESDATSETDTGSVVIRVADVPSSDEPENLSVASITLTTARIEWDPPLNLSGALETYQVRFRQGSGAWSDWISTRFRQYHVFRGLRPGTAYGFQGRTKYASGISSATGEVAATTPLASLHNAIIFKFPANYNDDNDRVTVRGATRVVREMVDNDYNTYSAEDDVDVNIADADGNATRVDAIVVKCSGVTSHQGDPTGGSGSGWAARTIPDTVENYAGDSVSTTVGGFQHDLYLLDTHFTATSVRLRFTGSDIKIYAVMLLEIVAQWDVNQIETLSADPEQIDKAARLQQTQGRGPALASVLGGERPKWEIDYSVKVIPGRTINQVVDELLHDLDTHENCAFAREFTRFPDQAYPAVMMSERIQTRLIGQSKVSGEAVNFRIGEQ